MFGKTVFKQNIRLSGESVDIACYLCCRPPCSHQRLLSKPPRWALGTAPDLLEHQRLRALESCWVWVLGMGGWGLGFVCLLFLTSSEEYPFLLKASLCFYTHSKTAVPRKEAGRFKGRQERRWLASEQGILEACGQCFDDKREGMFPALPDASSSTLHQRARVWG